MHPNVFRVFRGVCVFALVFQQDSLLLLNYKMDRHTHTHTARKNLWKLSTTLHCDCGGQTVLCVSQAPKLASCWQAASAIAGRCSTALGVPGPTTMMMMRRFSWISSVRVGTAGCAQSRARRTEAWSIYRFYTCALVLPSAHHLCGCKRVGVCVCVAVEFAQACWQSVILPTKNIFANLKNHQIVSPCERMFLFGVFFLSNPDPAPSLGLSLP